jgi:hypothetical protein
MDKFAKSPEIVGDDIEFLVESLDPSSFGRGTGVVANIDPEKIRFKDPARQAEYEQFLEDEWLNYDMDEQTRRSVLYPRVRAIAEEKILNMSPEELFKDAPPPNTITGASIDITPEMREKITTKGQPLFAVPPAAAGAAALLQEEEPVQEYKEAGRVEKKKGMQQEQFDPPFDESRRMGPKVGVSSGPAKIRDLAKILRGENSEQQNLSRQRIAGNVEAGKGLGEYLYDMMVPQTGWEWAAEAAFFPVPRPVRKGLLAAAGAMYDPEAEAGKLTLLHGSPSKIKSLQEGKDLWATTDPEYALKRAMDKMRIAEGAKGPGYLNQFQIEDTDLMRLADKYSPEDIAIARRAFSKLPEGREMTGEEIYEVASTNTGGAKTAALEGVTRALGKKGYQVPSGADDKGDWYRVLNQTDLERFGKGGKVIDALKGALKMTDEAPDPSRRKAIGLREQITQPGAMTTVETEVSASDLDTLQKAMGNVGRAILNEPVTRRDVLKRGALSTVSDLLPAGGVMPQLIKAATSNVAPLTKAAEQITEEIAAGKGLIPPSPEQIQEIVRMFEESGQKTTERGLEKFLDYGGFDAIDDAILSANKLDHYPDDDEKIYDEFLNLSNFITGDVRDEILQKAKKKKKTDPAIAEMYPNQVGAFKGITQKEIDEIVNEFADGDYALTNKGIEQFMDNYGFDFVDNALAAKNNLRAADMEKDEIVQLMNADYQTVMDELRNKRKASKKKAD